MKKIENYKVTDIQDYNGILYCIVENSGLYSMENDSLQLVNSNNKSLISNPEYLYRNEGKLYAGSSTEFVIVENKDKASKYTLDSNSLFILSNGNKLWNCKGNKG